MAGISQFIGRNQCPFVKLHETRPYRIVVRQRQQQCKFHLPRIRAAFPKRHLRSGQKRMLPPSDRTGRLPCGGILRRKLPSRDPRLQPAADIIAGLYVGYGHTVFAADGIERLAHLDEVVNILIGHLRQRRGKIVHLRQDLLRRGLVHLGLADEQFLPCLQMRRVEPRIVLYECIDCQRVTLGDRVGGLARLHGMGYERPLHLAAGQLYLRHIGTEHPDRFARFQSGLLHRRIVFVKTLLGDTVQPRQGIDRFARGNPMQIVVRTCHAHHFGRPCTGDLGGGLSEQEDRRRQNYQPTLHHRSPLTFITLFRRNLRLLRRTTGSGTAGTRSTMRYFLFSAASRRRISVITFFVYIGKSPFIIHE